LGLFCAQYPFLVLLLGTLVIAGLSCGLVKFQVTTDPVKLWSAKSSIARQQKDYFDTHFKYDLILINNQTKIDFFFLLS
jgi:Niemann-Pick C1 protein